MQYAKSSFTVGSVHVCILNICYTERMPMKLLVKDMSMQCILITISAQMQVLIWHHPFMGKNSVQQQQ